jgi:3-oxoacyl-[acyl-carrier protein] reductase
MIRTDVLALATGASREIGRAIAVALARNGAGVAVNARRQLEKPEEIAAAIRAMNVNGGMYMS